jgi:putative membrane protein
MINNEKVIKRIIWGVSIFVFLAVAVLDQHVLPVPFKIPSWVYSLSALNACINATCTLLLLTSLYQIKRKNITLHKKLNLLTFGLSSLFLVSYILYHWMVGDTSFPKDNNLKYIYYPLLISHILLAASVLPLILLSFLYGLKMEVEKHRKIVRFTFPIWLYVTTTGVLVYLMISPYYHH